MPKGTTNQDPKDQHEEEFAVEPEENTDLIEDLMEEEAPVSDEEPEEEELEEGPEEEEEVEEPETEEPRKYKLRGQEYTLEQLVEAGLLDQIVTQSEQVAHYQDLYHGIKQQVDAIQAQQAQPVQPAQQPQAISPSQIKAAMQPFLVQAVQNGYMEQEFVEDYPAAAAVQMHVYNDFMQLRQLVQGMYQYFMRENADKMFKQVKANFNAVCQSLVTRHPVYKTLETQEERDRFFDYVATKINPEAGAINDEFLGRAYLGFQQESVLPVMKQGSVDRQKKRKKQRKLAAGEGSAAPRKAKSHQRQPGDDELIIAGMMDHFYKNH